MEMINASEKVGIDVTTKLCQRVLDGKDILHLRLEKIYYT